MKHEPIDLFEIEREAARMRAEVMSGALKRLANWLRAGRSGARKPA